MDWNKVGKLDARSWNGKDGTIDFVSVTGRREKLELGRGTSFEEIERMIGQNIATSLATLDERMEIHRGSFQARVENTRNLTVQIPGTNRTILTSLPDETGFPAGSRLAIQALLITDGGDLASAVAARLTPAVPAPEMEPA